MGFDLGPGLVDGTTSVLSSLEGGVRSLGRRIGHLHPALYRTLLSLWGAYLWLYAAVANGLPELACGRLHAFEPFRVVSVDPDDIEFMVEYSALPRQARDRDVFPASRFRYAGAVRDGDWDQSTRRFEESEFYRSLEAHFERGVDWEETDFFGTAVEYIENGTHLWGCETRADFRERCRELDALYESIRENGYLSQKDLLERSVEDPTRDSDDGRPHRVRLVTDEMAVCVGREGEVLFKDGRNRLAIAKILGLDSIPVWVLVRHSRWQRLRARVAADPSLCDSLDGRLRRHPDLDACS